MSGLEPLLQVREIRKYFPIEKGFVISRVVDSVKAVDGISFCVNEGETFGLVGESGCGKTTVAKLILLLEKLTDGAILFRNSDIARFQRKELKQYRHSVQAVFQDPYSSLNPRIRVGDIVGEPVAIADTRITNKELSARVTNILGQVGLNSASANQYPHELSGGQRQRVALARALSVNPRLIVLDEPISALDLSIRAQIMNLLRDLQETYGLAYLLIAHDLAVVKHMSTRIGVMYLGKIVEHARSNDLYSNPLHPYTLALLSAALPSHPDIPRKEIILPGEVPSPINPPAGCRFHPRCIYAKPVCAEVEPELTEAASHHEVACHFHFDVS